MPFGDLAEAQRSIRAQRSRVRNAALKSRPKCVIRGRLSGRSLFSRRSPGSGRRQDMRLGQRPDPPLPVSNHMVEEQEARSWMIFFFSAEGFFIAGGFFTPRTPAKPLRLWARQPESDAPQSFISKTNTDYAGTIGNHLGWPDRGEMTNRVPARSMLSSSPPEPGWMHQIAEAYSRDLCFGRRRRRISSESRRIRPESGYAMGASRNARPQPQ